MQYFTDLLIVDSINYVDLKEFHAHIRGLMHGVPTYYLLVLIPYQHAGRMVAFLARF